MQDFATIIHVEQTPEEVFKAVTNVHGWWSETIEGGTEQLNDEFIYRHKGLHYSRQKLIEVVSNKKLVWLVTDSSLSFIKNNTEWTGTKIFFEITSRDNQTALHFTHWGLVPEMECFESCSGGWNYYLHSSLFPLITRGKGQPDKKEIQGKYDSTK